MDKFLMGVLIAIFLLWLPLFIPAMIAWFTPEIEVGHKFWYTIAVCAIWIPIIGAWIDANR